MDDPSLRLGGPGLVFVAYPSALELLPGSRFFSIVFFLTLFFLAIDSAFSIVEAVVTALSDASFANLVGVTSRQQPSLSRVAAGDPDNSYLVQKIEGTAASGQRMPLGGGVLDQAVIDDIRLWIANGADR